MGLESKKGEEQQREGEGGRIGGSQIRRCASGRWTNLL